MTETVYIAGRMRGVPFYNFPAFDAARDKLKAEGYEVISPADMDRAFGFDPFKLPENHDWKTIPEGFNFEATVARCLRAVRRADRLYLLPGWESSAGARAEHAVAQWLGKHIHYPPETVLQEAQRIVYGRGETEYGHPRDDFARASGAFAALTGLDFKPEHVPLFQICVKMSRECQQPKRDNRVDIAGYAECLNRMHD